MKAHFLTLLIALSCLFGHSIWQHRKKNSSSIDVLEHHTHISNNIRILRENNYVKQRDTMQSISFFSDLEQFADFDPEEDGDEDGTKMLEILDLTLQILERLEKTSTTLEMKAAVFSREQADANSQVSRKYATTSIPQGIDLSPTETISRGAEPSLSEEKFRKERESRFGPIINLVRKLKENKRADRLEYASYPRHPSYPDQDLSSMMKMIDGVPPLNMMIAPKKIVRILQNLLQSLIGLAMTDNAVKQAETVEAMYKALFTKPKIFGFIPNPLDLIPAPTYIMEHWENDKEVARQFLSGTNPVMISVAKYVKQMSRVMVKYLGLIYLQRLIDEKRLFFVSYTHLEELKDNPHQAYPLPMNEYRYQDEPRYYFPAFVLFRLDDERKELDIIGIQLERKPGARIYTRNNSEESDWLFAKASLMATDSQVHEWVSHLGRTHLTMEPHIIAIHNTLRKKQHPIYTFVKPLCKDTLVVNWAARELLTHSNPNSFGDYATSIGTGQIMQLIREEWSSYSFFNSSGLPAELASRGFDADFNMPSYLYREDGMKLWNAYGDFAIDFVDEVYVSDYDVAFDEIIQQWAVETTAADRGAVPGFPTSFTDKATLAKVLQTLMWITSGLHAAVNYPQYDYLAYAPNKPLSMRANSVPKSDLITEREWMHANAFPDVDVQKEVLSIVRLLTLPSEHCIDNLSDNFSLTGKEAYSKFQDKLDQIGTEIEARNKQKARNKEAIYSYLNPTVVPASIDI